MTNYFKVSRGVRQGCPSSPFLFVLAVEILAIKLRHDPDCEGIIRIYYLPRVKQD